MDKNKILETIKKARESAKKRNFSQSFDLIINLQQLDLKKPEHKVDLFINLPKGRGKKVKVCGLFGPELYKEGEANCDKTILQDNFQALAKNKRELKNMIKEYDFFLGQANIMPLIAKNFGRVLGTKGKMPNPKAGMIVPPKAQLKPVMEKMQKLIRVMTKAELVVKCSAGTETMSDEDLVENINHIYTTIENYLPQHDQNIKNSFLKLTMGKPVLLGGKI
ncbi:50S ribosomal protein L1 [archaeon]|nr:50S ribosomal protein L1 [archaeon]MAG78411.1 50S ribosomal protein L1 [archaeon]|tara:strand:- start:582 stop:1244 length:663 start_codon:yes stop_codon:yes gene_type:complete